jgi:hypothetical protein
LIETEVEVVDVNEEEKMCLEEERSPSYTTELKGIYTRHEVTSPLSFPLLWPNLFARERQSNKVSKHASTQAQAEAEGPPDVGCYSAYLHGSFPA